MMLCINRGIMFDKSKINDGKRVFDIEIEALRKTRDALDEAFLQILSEIVNCEGKVILTGIGKPGHIASKIAATLSSLGTPAFFLHPAEAMHGDLGMVSKEDIVIAISYSGESDEIINILPNIKLIGAKLIGITGNSDSALAHEADIVQVFPSFEEACHLGLAPTSSTTVTLCYGDALAVVASEIYGFKDVDFSKFHPAGTLGKKLTIRVKDIMALGVDNSIIKEKSTLKDAIVELSKKGLGIVSVIDDENNLKGVITDGDLRRQLDKGADIYSLNVEDAMSVHPVTVDDDRLAIAALMLMKEKNISCLPVLRDGKVVGTLRLQDVLGVGIVG